MKTISSPCLSILVLDFPPDTSGYGGKEKASKQENPYALTVTHSGTFGGQKVRIQSGFIKRLFLKNSSGGRLTAALWSEPLVVKGGGK